MAMFLSGVATIIIQRLGRWESDVFMEYIREQVETFTVGVSRKMLAHQDYYHLNKLEEERTSCRMYQHWKGMTNPLRFLTLLTFQNRSLVWIKHAVYENIH